MLLVKIVLGKQFQHGNSQVHVYVYGTCTGNVQVLDGDYEMVCYFIK